MRGPGGGGHEMEHCFFTIARSFGTKVAQKSFEIYHVDEACAPPEQSVLESFSHFALRVFCLRAVCRLIWCGLVVTNRFVDVTLGSARARPKQGSVIARCIGSSGSRSSVARHRQIRRANRETVRRAHI